MGRAWLHGLLPYRDAFDHKPPGIYLLHALAIRILGHNQWGIRLLEIFAVILMGWLAARLVGEKDEPLPGLTGAAVLITAGYYFTALDYWDTAQVELWEALALLGSCLAALRLSRLKTAAAVAGALAGLAFIFKFPAALAAIAPAACIGWRSLREGSGKGRSARAIVHLSLFALGTASVIGAFTGYFWVKGGLKDMLEVLIGYNLYYLRHKVTTPQSARWLVAVFGTNASFWLPAAGLAWGGGLLAAWRRRDGQGVRAALAVPLLLALAVLSVVAQKKYYFYHWGVLTPFMALCWIIGAASLFRGRPRLVLFLAAATMTVGFALAPTWENLFLSTEKLHCNMTYRSYTLSFWRYALGRIDRRTFLKPFLGESCYNYREQERLGLIIRERARPGDTLRVRGFEPAIYVVSGLSCPTRFFTEFVFSDHELRYKRKKWRAPHLKLLRENPPRFQVVFRYQLKELGALSRKGYKPLAKSDNLLLLELKPKKKDPSG